MSTNSTLIKNVELEFLQQEVKANQLFDVFLQDGIIADIQPTSHNSISRITTDRTATDRTATNKTATDKTGTDKTATDDIATIDAEGSALIPGLYDHHIHLLAVLESFQSLDLSLPQNRPNNLGQLEHTLKSAASPDIRAIGYHESMAGALNRQILDGMIPNRAVRIQHRSGALWVLNSKALEGLELERLTKSHSEGSLHTNLNSNLDSNLGSNLDSNLEDGYLYRNDDLLVTPTARKNFKPNLGRVAKELNAYGVTGTTDATPGYTREEVKIFRDALQVGDFSCKLLLMADDYDAMDANWMGPKKIIVDDFALPSFADLCELVAETHKKGRSVAIHSVSRTTLALVLAVFTEIGSIDGDRIEHASVAPPELVVQLAKLGVRIVTQPNFVWERGDTYLKEVPSDDLDWLYRCRGWLEEGVRLAAGTDAPFGSLNPWDAIWAAVNRKTREGRVINPNERLDFTSALALFLSAGDNPGGKPRSVRVGVEADLCLLSAPLNQIAKAQAQNPVAQTFVDGKLVSTQ